MMQPHQQRRRRLNGTKGGGGSICCCGCSVSIMIVYGMICMMCLYVSVMIYLSQYTHSVSTSGGGNTGPVNAVGKDGQQQRLKPFGQKYSQEQWGNQIDQAVAAAALKKQRLKGIKPELLIPIDHDKRDPNKMNRHHDVDPADMGHEPPIHNLLPKHVLSDMNVKDSQNMDRHHDIDPADNAHIPPIHYDPQQPQQASSSSSSSSNQHRILTAYLESVDQDEWEIKPLPIRTSTSEDLMKVSYPRVNSCSKLLEQFPIDDYPGEIHDPFLPWIHDVFPTEDGKYIMFIAQNKRRCKTGTTPDEVEYTQHMSPQIALFQHVPIQRIKQQQQQVPNENENENDDDEIRYRLSSQEDADDDGIDARFICQFQPSGQETLSVFNVNYEWASYRKKHKKMFNKDGHKDGKFIHSSQLVFKCPVPPNLIELIRNGNSVINDYATQFVNLIPIRTPPRYHRPNVLFPEYYKEFQYTKVEDDDTFGLFNTTIEWGTNHILPRIVDSGRWENIPICKPSLLQYRPIAAASEGEQNVDDSKSIAVIDSDGKPIKKHKLVSCLWASTGYTTRGNRFAINDGQRRLLEWITYNKLIGFEHFYLYDNSNAFVDEDDRENHHATLKSIADLFPNDVTYINWPAQICNNNPNNVDSVGERSSQYAAEASCRLRFGPHVDWIGQFDIDEYLVPMADHTSIHPILDKLDEEGMKIISFASWRAWPRRRFIEPIVVMKGRDDCGRNDECFQLKIPMETTMLQAYNCDRQKPGQKKDSMPAEKQIYRPSYVKQHFIHYSTITEMSEFNREDFETYWREVKGQPKKWNPHSAFPDPLSRFGNEVEEGLMIHTKAVATQDTIGWKTACAASSKDTRATCRLGTPFPPDDGLHPINEAEGDEGWKYNCYVNQKAEQYWVKQLEEALKSKIPELGQKFNHG